MLWIFLCVYRFRKFSIHDLVASFIGQCSYWLLACPSLAGSNTLFYSASVYDLHCGVLCKFGQKFSMFVVKFESLIFSPFLTGLFSVYFGWHAKQNSPSTGYFMGGRMIGCNGIFTRSSMVWIYCFQVTYAKTFSGVISAPLVITSFKCWDLTS